MHFALRPLRVDAVTHSLRVMLRNRLLFLHVLLLLIGLETSLPAEEHDAKLPPAASRQVDYERDVQPIFQSHCLDCHGPDTQESHLRVDRERSLLAGGDSGEPAVIRGESAGSLLVRAVAGLDPNLQMPPGDSLTADEIGILRAWIDRGMPGIESDDEEGNSLGTDHWSFQPVRRPEVPEPPSIDGHSPRRDRSVQSAEPPPIGLDSAEIDRNSLPRPPQNEQAIDAFIATRLHEAGLDFSPPADRRTLIRRLYLDVLGLLPHPSEVDEFLQDTSPDAYEQLVERALAHPGYGERWGRHWLDVVRFAETHGFETNTPRPNAYHYRDYVIQALNQDKPYDQFVLEQLAGDTIGADAATGFLVAGPYDEVKSPDVNLTMMQRQDELADMINVSGGAFLGLTLGCARCHNHKFDPVPQRDYYALQAVFAGVRHGERPLPTEEGLRNREQASELAREQQPGPAAYIGQLEQPPATRRLYRGDPMQPREEVLPDALSVLGTLGLSEATPEPQRRLALAQWIVSEDNPLAARVIANRVWQHHFGRGLVTTPSDFGGNGVQPSHPKLLDWLACELRDHGWSLKHLHRQILASRTYRQSSTPYQAGWEADAESRLLWRFPPRRLEAEVLRDNLLAVSGVLDNGMFGPGFDAFEPNSNYVRVYIPKETMGPETWRRMVYMTKVRMEQDAVFGAFDCPDAGQATPVRGRSTTAIQALNLFNSPFVNDLAQRLADRISQECEASRSEWGQTESEPSSSVAARADEMERLFRLALGRSPSDEEREDALRLSNEYGLSAVCRAVLNSNEFLTIP